jgi:hypothetical protein
MVLAKRLWSWYARVWQSEYRAAPLLQAQSLSLSTGCGLQVPSQHGHADEAPGSRDFQRQLVAAKAPIRWYGDPRDIYLA